MDSLPAVVPRIGRPAPNIDGTTGIGWAFANIVVYDTRVSWTGSTRWLPDCGGVSEYV